jgi:hypothetical protein
MARVSVLNLIGRSRLFRRQANQVKARRIAAPSEYSEQIDDGESRVPTTGRSGERIVWANVIGGIGSRAMTAIAAGMFVGKARGRDLIFNRSDS